MFFSGSLQEGIGSALQSSKAVVCFVNDQSETSSLWETLYFTDRVVADALEANAVVLKLDSNSQEAGFLKVYSPIEEPPVVIVIRNGQLKESLDNTLSQDVFRGRLLGALGALEGQASTGPSISQSQQSPDAAINTAIPSGTSHSDNVQAMMAERKAKLEAHKQAEEARDTAERAAIAKARREKAEASAVPGSKRAKELKYAQEQRQRQKDARLERERILRLVEHDKAERREREQRRRAQAKTLQTSDSRDQALQTPSMRSPGKCALQIRLLDGTSMKKIFEHSATLGDDVRPWIDAERTEGDTPYTFRHVKNPLPNKSIDVSEEGQTLQSLGLTPSATLVLLPVKGFSDAYSDESAGLFARGISSGYGLVSSGVGLVGSTVGMLFGSGAEQNTDTVSQARDPPKNVNTLQDHQPDDNRQFYNGNQLNFEPRQDDSSSKND